MKKPDVLSEIEAILKVSGVSAYLPDEIKDSVCHSVAIDIVAYYEPLIQQAKAKVAREIEQSLRSALADSYCRTICDSETCKMYYYPSKPLCEFLEKIIEQSLKDKYIKEAA